LNSEFRYRYRHSSEFWMSLWVPTLSFKFWVPRWVSNFVLNSECQYGYQHLVLNSECQYGYRQFWILSVIINTDTFEFWVPVRVLTFRFEFWVPIWVPTVLNCDFQYRYWRLVLNFVIMGTGTLFRIPNVMFIQRFCYINFQVVPTGGNKNGNVLAYSYSHTSTYVLYLSSFSKFTEY
jgi:hypothetical protein